MSQNISKHVKDSLYKPIDDVWRVTGAKVPLIVSGPAYSIVYDSIYTPVGLRLGFIITTHLNAYGRF